MNSIKYNITIDKSSDWQITFEFESTVGEEEFTNLTPLFIIRETNNPSSTLLVTGEITIIDTKVYIKVPFNLTKDLTQKEGYYNFVMYNSNYEYRISEGKVTFSETLRD